MKTLRILGVVMALCGISCILAACCGHLGQVTGVATGTIIGVTGSFIMLATRVSEGIRLDPE